jgi:uncharacterized RDD family membrane protein YckC
MSATPPPTVQWESPDQLTGPAPGVGYAPHGARLVAYILDGLFISILAGIPLLIGFILLGAGATIKGDTVTAVDPGATAAFFVLTIVSGVIAFFYFPFFWARGGQTLGMKPFSLRVVRDRDGGRIGWGTALLRLIGLWVAAAVFYIGFIWIFIDKRRRGWQDLIAGTVVIKRP